MTGAKVRPWITGSFKIVLFAVLALLLLYSVFFWFLRNPILFQWDRPTDSGDRVHADPARLERDVRSLTSLTPARNGLNLESLNQAAAYIAKGFSETGCRLAEQGFVVDHIAYKNVTCSFGPVSGPRIVIGAHYDVYSDTNPGADDNASGVAGLLELARLIAASKPELSHNLELVAYSLEEPPYFRSDDMGSFVHASRLVEDKVIVKLMVSVEMIGYFSDEVGSQSYPLSRLDWFYPRTANFIGVVGRSFDRTAVARVKELMAVSDALPVYSINAPALVPGIDFSDHLNYWHLGLPAVMVTDTAFLRNPNYHRPSDTPDTLDYRRMGLVVDGLYRVAVGYPQ